MKERCPRCFHHLEHCTCLAQLDLELEHDIDPRLLLDHDRLLYGISIVDTHGERIDPRDVGYGR